MKILLLRGKEPTDRDPSETYYKSIAECDDIYTLILHKMVEHSHEHKAQIWYWGGRRIKEYAPNLTEIRVSRFSEETIHFIPDVIIARGGFAEYDTVLERYPHAFKIYYGAHAERFYPSGFCDYNVILVDSNEQMELCNKMFPDIHCEMMLKPAADNLIFPVNVPKEYDICFPANGKQMKYKGHEFVYLTAPKDLRILNLGNPPKLHIPPNITNKRVQRKDIGREYSKCKIGIVCCNKGLDSCPRVLPEMLACNLPVVCLDTFYFWKDKYINKYTGLVTSKDKFWDVVKEVLANTDSKFSPEEYYHKHLSINKAAEHLWNIINKYKAC